MVQTRSKKAAEAQGSKDGIEPQASINKNENEAENGEGQGEDKKGDQNQEAQVDQSPDKQDVNNQEGGAQKDERPQEEQAHQQDGAGQEEEAQEDGGDDDNKDNKDDDGDDDNKDDGADDHGRGDDDDDDNDDDDDDDGDDDDDDGSGDDDSSDEEEEAEHDARPKRRQNPHLKATSGQSGKAGTSRRATSVEFEEHEWATPTIPDTKDAEIRKLVLTRDPDNPEAGEVVVEIQTVLAFREYLFVLAPSLSEATQYQRALIIKSGEHREQKKRFMAKYPIKQLCAAPDELPVYEKFVITAVGVSPNGPKGSKGLTFVAGYEKGTKKKGQAKMKIWSRSSCELAWGTDLTIAVLNAQRKLVGQKDIPQRRNRQSAETSLYVKEFYRTKTGKATPPKPQRNSPLHKRAYT